MSYVTVSSGKFMQDGKRFRFIGVNKYPLLVSTMAQSDVSAFFQGCKNRSVSVVRTWCFDAGNPPSNSLGNFRYLQYPVGGTNLITDGGFESGGGSYTLSGSPAWVVTSADAHSGTHSLTVASPTNNYPYAGKAVTVVAHTDYVWTVWVKVQIISGDGSHLPPELRVGTTAGAVDVAWSGFLGDTAGQWQQIQVKFNSGTNTTLHFYIDSDGGQNTVYTDDWDLEVAQTPVMQWREAAFQQLDMILDQARQYGIKLILSLADNPTYGTKQAYCHMADAIYGTSLEAAGSPYVGFFDNTNCRTLYKNFMNKLATRVNTINGRTYSSDDTIFSWELGNELRYDLFTSEGGTQNTSSSTDIAAVKAWIIDVAGYMKTIDTNHLIGYGDMGHTWQWVNGDVVSNGSGYGVDYNIFATLSQLDYVDFHLYPTQGDNVHLQEYGQRLGYPNAVSEAGYKAQIRDYVSAAKANGKPCVVGELGMIRDNIADTTYTRLYPRSEAFRTFYVTFFEEADGDGILFWHGEIADSSSYTINLAGWDGTTTNLNYDDRPLANHINERNGMINGKRIVVI